ncbi:MAG TPA: hypothetical protein VK714_20350 [Myxococcota bacterium]|nr:hypothetical protein [Myxococcota bacterium]
MTMRGPLLLLSSSAAHRFGRLAQLVLAAVLLGILPQAGAQAGNEKGGGGPPGCPPGLVQKDYGCLPPGQAKNRVLRVGTFRGIPGQFTTIQSAVDAAHPGDWILVAPGDYHEQGDREYLWPGVASGGVYIGTPNLHLRGMDRNGVVVDGTKPGAPQCSSDPSDQDLGPLDWSGNPLGRNGVLVFKADNVVVENLTACNFLDGSGGGGNQIWWNGGYESGKVGLGPYLGQYLSATSTYFQNAQHPKAEYGIFVSNSRGPGLIVHAYASNMADSSFYIGACPDCNAVLADGHAQNSAQGYSGTNSGGHLVIAYSEWDGNLTGISANSQNSEGPSPQSGKCPDAEKGLTGNGLCTYFIGNYIHDNNNPNVPGAGLAGMGPLGTGMLLSGGQYDTVAWNRVEHNGSWGLLLVPYVDFSNPPPPVANCAGGVVPQVTDPFPLGLLASVGATCYFDDFGNEVHDNFLRDNGSFGNDTNGDLGEISGLNDPGNCWYGNVDPNGVTSSPADLQTTHGTCGVPNQGAGLFDPIGEQLICVTQAFFPCMGTPGNPGYPQPTQVMLLPLPPQPSMEDACEGVPSNPWCEKESHEKSHAHGAQR